ncbi:hypothetical protein [Lentzea flaviverrucosa]|uniref:Uncharacterized protein n=1 Tax=Lentzea flaviverrucosa TaxID=200379 RepID=A0A1H9CYM3_9PSEU|nr:hypothetical protein [Lentzea flaviverrucosa]RDI24689.1 hypothetical protein DFR72_109269 [Lentzea flaviverrucosa]SEQ06295.1 hypothetical protein SAMN05216195_101924 [Lentzea flaviverrucosa]
MKDHTKAVGAIIGAAGAQILTIALFYFLAEPCDCAQRLCFSPENCLWGQTLFEYWASVGTIGTALFTVIGYIIGSLADDA